MAYFDEFVSNTTAGTSNQSFFTDGNGVGRVFYRLLWGGEFPCSLLFSNRVDSTFGSGDTSRANQLCDPWTLAVSCCVCRGANDPDIESREWIDLTFDSAREKTAAPGELFSTDAFTLSAGAGDYLCVQITFRGSRIPCHPEINIPTFVKDGDRFVPSEYVPVPNMIGVRRSVKTCVGFLGTPSPKASARRWIPMTIGATR